MNTLALQKPLSVISTPVVRVGTTQIRASDVRPGDVICSHRPYLDMPVKGVTVALDGYICFYANNGAWKKYHKAGDMLTVRQASPVVEVVDINSELEADARRPFDWQDKLIIGGAAVTGFIALCILVWGR